MGFIDVIKAKAKADKKTIVLPESMDRRTWVAAEKILKEGLANLVIIGTPEDIGAHSEGLDVSGATIINPQTYEKTQEYIDLFVELRKSKGMTPEKAKETILSDYAYYGCLMIKNGDADGIRCLPLYRKHPSSVPAGDQDQTGHQAGIRILLNGSSGLRSWQQRYFRICRLWSEPESESGRVSSNRSIFCRELQDADRRGAEGCYAVPFFQGFRKACRC